MDVPSHIIDAIKAIALRYPAIRRIFVYGSRARGDASERSDIDIAVYLWDESDYGAASSLNDDIDEIDTLLSFDVTPIHKLLDKKFLASVENEGICIYMGKFENKYENFKKAVQRLSDVIEDSSRLREVLIKDGVEDILRDSVIQRFEFSYELAWKTLKEYLHANGLSVETLPRLVFKAAYQHNLINDEGLWLQMINDRNATSHLYAETFANTVAQRVTAQYLPAFRELEERLRML